MNYDILILVITGFLAVFSPLAIAWAKKESWSQLAKTGIPIVVTLLIAALYVTLAGRQQLVTLEDYLQTALTVFGIQQIAYTTFLKWLATILEQVGNKDSNADPEENYVPEHRA